MVKMVCLLLDLTERWIRASHHTHRQQSLASWTPKVSQRGPKKRNIPVIFPTYVKLTRRMCLHPVANLWQIEYLYGGTPTRCRVLVTTAFHFNAHARSPVLSRTLSHTLFFTYNDMLTPLRNRAEGKEETRKGRRCTGSVPPRAGCGQVGNWQQRSV